MDSMKLQSISTTTAIQASLPKHDLKGQSLAVIGLGKSGLAAVRLALARGASVLAIDQNENLDPFERNPVFEKHNSVKTILGHFDNNLLKDVDTVVVSPGVPPEAYSLSSLLQLGKRVTSELDFAAEVLPRCTKILAVTGTNGKSTVATFAGQMLNHLDIKTFVGGNLGIPLSEVALQCLESTPESPVFEVAVVEVSSYQLEIAHKYFSPSVAVILNLTPDHLERHKTMENYALTKCRILSHMSNSKMGILPLGNQHLNDAVRSSANDFNLAWIGAFPGVRINLEAKVASFRIPAVQGFSELQLSALKTIGTHNYHNAAVAALSVIGLDIGIDAEAISSTIGKLKVPPHRMEIVHTDNHGVIWVDDSKATNVEATYTGLMGLKGQKSVILLGGVAKIRQGSSGFERLLEHLIGHRGIVTFGYSGMMIQKTLSTNGLSIPCIRATNLEDAVKQARSMTTSGDAIVLSPGCASFDEFKNFEHRGRVFRELALSSE
ncbi:UDP-N-acetylmuramoylalanine--D-glutamate ligase [Camellia lanceoleosa]|uniref:UDP-N-acetylmuramoylalanine--D-glutamate ligase n=1 Tax=Camellia lanceoleosa TaxID=1840588 RepID=A0ACC0GD60_9ERIC|nr:UDP-N-acetylmuramoylalanine--D-glutamate ligase [Camellia lanceoleosa]